jgi:hypothetical protein
MLWGSVNGVAQLGKLRRLAPGLLEPDRLCEGLLHGLLVGWGARPQRAERAIALVRDARLAEATVSAADLAALAAPTDR